VETENVTSEKNEPPRKMLIIVSVLTLVIFGLIVHFIVQTDEVSPLVNEEQTTSEKRAYTQTEKQQILTELKGPTSIDAKSVKQKEQILNELSRKSAETPVSEEEKLRILQDLAARAEQ